VKKLILLITLTLGAAQPVLAMDATQPLKMTLHAAAFLGDTELCKQLILERADVNKKVLPSEKTPLHYAAAAGNVIACYKLIAAGASLNILDKEAHTPLTLAIARKHIELVQAILTTPLRNEYKKMKANRCGLIAIRFAQPRLPRDVRLLIDRQLINSFVQDHMHRIEKMLAYDRNLIPSHPNDIALPLAQSMHHTQIAQMLDLNNPDTVKLIIREVRPLISRLLIPKPKPLELVSNTNSENQITGDTELIHESQETFEENTDTKENPWEFL
jgi:hypothetical protein